jgi:hypothetical protein
MVLVEARVKSSRGGLLPTQQRKPVMHGLQVLHAQESQLRKPTTTTATPHTTRISESCPVTEPTGEETCGRQKTVTVA